jgi:hypothetical protein
VKALREKERGDETQLTTKIRAGKRKEGMKLNLPPKFVEKLVWVQLFRFVKFHSQLSI